MSKSAPPVVGNWYRDMDEDETFTVLFVDEENELIEIQHDDGDIEDVDFEIWNEMDLEPAEVPE